MRDRKIEGPRILRSRFMLGAGAMRGCVSVQRWRPGNRGSAPDGCAQTWSRTPRRHSLRARRSALPPRSQCWPSGGPAARPVAARRTRLPGTSPRPGRPRLRMPRAPRFARRSGAALRPKRPICRQDEAPPPGFEPGTLGLEVLRPAAGCRKYEQLCAAVGRLGGSFQGRSQPQPQPRPVPDRVELELTA